MNKITLPEWAHVIQDQAAPNALNAFRQKHWETFSQKGLPTKRDERWKYADFGFLQNHAFVSSAPFQDEGDLIDIIAQHRLQKEDSILLLMVNGHFISWLSDLIKLPEGVEVLSLKESYVQHADLLMNQSALPDSLLNYPLASLNAATCQDGLFLYVREGVEIEKPIHFLSLHLGSEASYSSIQNYFILEKSAKVTILEEHYANNERVYFSNSTTSVRVNDEAMLSYYKLQEEGKCATHIAHAFIEQARQSTVDWMQFTKGALFARDDLTVNLKGEGALCRTSGFYQLYQDKQYRDHHIDMNHLAPRSQSEMLYKGILDWKTRAVFNGKVFVEKDAQKILAHQANHHLLLSNAAEACSSPELEIYADDVQCKHGATSGQLDQDALFYMRSRGIEAMDATRILLQGFAEEVFERIARPSIKFHIEARMID